MADPAHLKLITAGVAGWNEWRMRVFQTMANLRDADLRWRDLREANLRKADLCKAKLIGADLCKADLSGADLSEADLSGADLSEAILERTYLRGADLSRTELSKAKLIDAKLSGAKLIDAKLSGAYLRWSDFSGAELNKAKLSGADLSEAKLIGADLCKADLSGAILFGAHLGSTNLSGAVLSGADFSWADLSGADLNGTDLSGANLQGVKGLRLDATYIKGARFPAYANDPWSVLRRSYTGPRLLFHLLLLIAFFIPYTLQTINWLTINRGQGLFQKSADLVKAMGDRIAKVSPAQTSADSAFKREAEIKARQELALLLEQLSHMKACLADDCVPVPVWKLLLGFDRGVLYGLLGLSLILYNVIRVTLTWTVGTLREEEERSGYAPVLGGLNGYRLLYRLHLFAFMLLTINVGSLIWHGWDWLNLPVLLPKQ